MAPAHARSWHLETERLVLRPFTLDDMEVAHEALDLDQDEPGMTLEERRAATAYRMTQLDWDAGIGCYAVQDRASAALLGYVGLQFHVLPTTPVASPEVELFYKLRRSAWGCGYAREACQAMLGFASATVRLGRLVSVTERANLRSVRLLERLGAEIRDHPVRDDLVIGVISLSPPGQKA